ncbi:SEC10/PgrA surface exclusion domain-containing protein [Streptococcus pluranimalium]|uniref:SEC10/PgrA surface exclusion domain-containing protein n=1 Tax=Streptococcus pluranimalium TaxID=82348 RepID=UPI00313A09BC
MFKNEIKGHGTIKKLRTGAVVSVLALSVAGVSGVVSADEVTATDASTVVNAEASEGVSEPILVETPKVADADVDSAKADATEANQAVTAQESVVTNAENAVVTNDATVTDLNKQIEEVNTVTPEVVEEAEADATSAESNLATANETVTSAEASLADASSKVEAQEGVVSDAQAEANKTASAVADAEKKVEGLSTATDTAKLEQDVDNLTTKVAEDTTNVQSAKDALDAAKLAETNKEQAIEDQKAVVADAEKVVDSTAKDYSDAINAQKGTQATEDSAKSTLDEAKKGTTITETVKVGETTTVTASGASLKAGTAVSSDGNNGLFINQEYIDAIKALANGTGSVQAVKDAIKKGDEFGNSLDLLSSPGNSGYEAWMEMMGYTFSNTDSVTKLSPSALTDAQLTDLALFYTALVNDVRSKVGTNLLTVTDESVAEAKKVISNVFSGVFPAYSGMSDSQRSASGFWSTTQEGFDGTGRKDVTSVVKGLDSSSNTIIGQLPAHYGNYANFDGRMQTMAELKGKVLAIVGEQLYTIKGRGSVGEAYGGVDGERSENFELALEVLGLRGSASTVGFGFEFTDLSNGMVQKAPSSYVVLGNAGGSAIDNPYLDLVDAETTVTPIYETKTRTVIDQARVDEAQKAYDEAVKANQVAKDAVAEKETAYNDAQTKFETAQKQLADLQNGTVDIPSLEQAVKDAEAQLEKDQASLQTVKETLALAKASAADRAKALEIAKSELADAKTANEVAQGVLSKEKETLEVLTKAKEVATMALADAKSKQATAQTAFDTVSAKASDLANKLANKETVLADLNAKLADATAKSSVLRAELETAKELLETLKADANAKNAEYIRILGLKAEQDKAEAEVGTSQVVNNKNVSSQTNQSVYNKAITAKITQNIVSRHQAGKTSYQASLPETGDESSLFGIMGASLLLGLGFVGKRRKV